MAATENKDDHEQKVVSQSEPQAVCITHADVCGSSTSAKQSSALGVLRSRKKVRRSRTCLCGRAHQFSLPPSRKPRLLSLSHTDSESDFGGAVDPEYVLLAMADRDFDLDPCREQSVPDLWEEWAHATITVAPSAAEFSVWEMMEEDLVELARRELSMQHHQARRLTVLEFHE